MRPKSTRRSADGRDGSGGRGRGPRDPSPAGLPARVGRAAGCRGHRGPAVPRQLGGVRPGWVSRCRRVLRVVGISHHDDPAGRPCQHGANGVGAVLGPPASPPAPGVPDHDAARRGLRGARAGSRGAARRGLGGWPVSFAAPGVGALFYASNWQQVYWTDFLPTPVSHMWSLSIEEQWYIVWPFLLAGLLWLSRGRVKVLAAAIAVLAVASAIWMAVLLPNRARRSCVLRDGRARLGTARRSPSQRVVGARRLAGTDRRRCAASSRPERSWAS